MWITRLFGLGGILFGGGKPRKPTSPGFIGGAGIAACVGVFIYGNIAHTWTVAWFVIVPLLCALFIALGRMAGGMERHQATVHTLKQMPDPPQAPSTAELRETVSALVGVDPGEKVTGVAVIAPPAPAPAPPEATPTTRLVTMGQVKAEPLDNERLTRVAAILLATCPTCTAEKTVFCTIQPGQQVYVLDKERSIVVHGSRIGHAVKIRSAKVADVTAQFNGSVPDEVWRFAL